MARWIRMLLLAGCLWPLLTPAGTEEATDVRVLIDISGSMRQNDPQNLRRPALRMLVGLLQPGTRAGVWTFAGRSQALIPMAEIDERWKRQALALAGRIRSPGRFTDIEGVLRDAIRGMDEAPKGVRRHLVLLTDGMVDVSKKPGESDASRARILGDLLTRIKALGIRVHTIALSARADHALMRALSEATGGWYQRVDAAEQLGRVFLKVFEQVGRPEGVPLEDNRFTVDASVKEATLLLFRRPGSADPVLIAPDGSRYTDSDLVAGVAWYRDQGYDLITIASPRKGEWRLQADVDPDNRVMIVTDLRLQTSEVPAHLAVGETLLLRAHLSNKGRLVDRRAFLRLLDVRADAITANGSDPLGLNDEGRDGDERAGDGRYAVRYREDTAFDEVELLFSVDSPTFMREKRFRLAVHEPARIEVKRGNAGPVAQVEVSRAVMRDGARLSVWQEIDAQRRPLERSDGGYPLVDPGLPVFVRIEGTTRLGHPVDRRYGPVYPPGVTPPPEIESPAAEEDALGQAPEAAATAAPAEADESPEGDEEGWLLPALLLGGVNLLLIGGGAALWWFLRRRRAAASGLSLEDEIASVSAPVATEDSGGVDADAVAAAEEGATDAARDTGAEEAAPTREEAA